MNWAMRFKGIILIGLISGLSGCLPHHRRPPLVTAYPASPTNVCERPGIPFYLPKPILVVSKNVYHIEEPTIGLTDSAPIPNVFDAQADYGDVNLRSNFVNSDTQPSGNYSGGSTNVTIQGEAASKSAPHVHSGGAPTAPGATSIPNDGLAPHMFFTYEFVFIPDMTQKYVLELNGGPGEIRAAMNLVNGWQFTGLGPYYLKDSSTAQNRLARGVALNLGLNGASDLVQSIADLKDLSSDGDAVSREALATMERLAANARQTPTFDFEYFETKQLMDASGRLVVPKIDRYAEVYVFEPHVIDGRMVWEPLTPGPISFDREYLGTAKAGGGDPAQKTGSNFPDPRNWFGVDPGDNDVDKSNTLPPPPDEIPLGRNETIVREVLGHIFKEDEPCRESCFEPIFPHS